MSKYFKIYCFFFSLFLMSCVSYKPFYNDSVSDWQENKTVDSTEIIYSVFLVGDARYAYSNDPVLKILEAQLKRAGKESAVIFLGDNIHPRGLPDSTNKLWDIAEKSILAQLEVLKDYKGEVIFIPGNHDWANGQMEGLEYVKNQRKYIEDYLNREGVFLPEKGRPGPVEINLSEDIVLILIDSQWWFQGNEKNYTGVVDEADLFIQIKDAVSRNRDKKIIFAAHHPLYSVGKHGGHFPLAINIFPLLEIKKILYLPLPGFIYTGYRKIFGINQDLSHPNYKLLREALLETFKGHSDIIYAAGHEHNLQYVNKNSIHHIISGAAGLTTYVARSKKTDFAQMQDGFATLNFYDNGDIWLEFWVTYDDQSQSAGRKDPVGKLAFRKKLFNKPIYVEKEQKKFLSQIDFSDSTVVAYPNGEKYQAGKIKKIFLGSNYRKEWITPIEVPVFDINKEKGGLKILKKGGGFQTKSLRLEDKNGKQWVLRSLEKDPSVGIPEAVKVNLAVDILDDQMSAYLPYAALSVPRLADAVEIYHTNPKVFYLTKDPRLGKYLDDISEGLFLFEERPTGNMKDVVSFGQSKNIIGSPDLLENIFEDPKYKVDQSFFLKSRFLDIFINDWDRHEDQWRWASFEKKGNIIYKPIPRDRDQTFFLNEGIIPWIASRKFAFRKNQGIDYDIKDMAGLTMQGIHLDRRFLNELPLEDWVSTAKKMQSQLTDKVIEDAIYDMPEKITEINGKEIISKLKSRRDKLNEFAKTYYSIMASKVDIVGTNKCEYFLVERLNDQTTKVTVFTLDKKGKKEDIYYQRLFNSDETKEIRLFGLEGKDEFKVTGEVNKGIKVRIVGGKGNDKITDKSEVKGLSKKTFVYDTKVKNDIKLGHEARNLTSNNPDNNQYIYKAFNYNKLIPLAYFGFNVDDGLVVGAGFWLTTYGFQKYPNSSSQNLNFNYSFATNAFEVKYESTFTSAVYGLDLHLRLNLRDPKYTQNFFGLGNETKKTIIDKKNEDYKDYNRVRIGQIIVNPEVSKTFNTYNTCFVGLSYQSFDVEETLTRFIVDFSQNQLSPDIFETHNYIGLNAGYKFDTRNNKVLTARGILWETNGSYFHRLSGSAGNYTQLKSDLSFYLSFRMPYRTVLAFRIGGSTNSGDYEFFQASSLGGKYNLRGYRATRFSGDACFYQNSEIRIKLFQFSNYLSKGQIGLIGFHDIGRVWLSGENSDIWHQGYGGGLWLSPYEVSVISATYEHSKEDELFSIKLNFLF